MDNNGDNWVNSSLHSLHGKAIFPINCEAMPGGVKLQWGQWILTGLRLMEKELLYERDFYGWTLWQAELLAKKAILELDWQNLREEVEALGRQELRELISRLTVLIGHLLKWNLQPEKRSRSWFLTIREQRRAIGRHLRHNPSLQSRQQEAMEDAYEAGVDLALRETGLPLRCFPQACPYGWQDILSDQFLCDTSLDWVDNGH